MLIAIVFCGWAVSVSALVPLDGAVKIEAGGSHTCSLTSGGGVKCWGDNTHGQLGDGTQIRRLAAVDVAGLAGGVTAIAAGAYGHTCALTTGGGVKCWGNNDVGQLGDGTFIGRLVPVDVLGLTNGVIAIAAGASHTCALTGGGAVKCWGYNWSGQLGDPTILVARATAATVTDLGSGVAAITAGDSHTCALIGGAVNCWGDNSSGQLGDGTTTNRPTPVAVVDLDNISGIDAGLGHTCALTIAGGVKCWGLNWEGQLGDGTTTSRLTAVDVTGLESGVSKIAVGGFHTCALTVGGGAKCWGDNSDGQLGDGTYMFRVTATNVAGLANGVTAIALGWRHSCAVTSGGAVKCWGGNHAGQLGNGADPTRPTAADVAGLGSGVSAMAAGGAHTCALTTSGGVKCWGFNGKGQLGDGTFSDRSTPVDVMGLTSGVIAIDAGPSHSCALTSGGAVKCWGDNWYGQLGDGTKDSRATPATVTGLDSGVMAIAAGGAHNCALIGDGIKCWGENSVGQLGDGTDTARLTIVDVTGLASGMRGVAAGAWHTCALTTAGGVKCWGWNEYGQLGDGTYEQRLTAVDVAGLSSGVSAVAPSQLRTCALTNGGAVKCWGVDYPEVPVSVGGFMGPVDALTARGMHSCGRSIAGAMKCWGLNYYGELGDGSYNHRVTPVDVIGLASGVNAMAAGTGHTCAVTSVGGAKCWGHNLKGQLGNGTPVVASVPVPANVLIAVPNRLAIAGLNGGVPIVAGVEFSVRIESRELDVTGAVQTATEVSLALTSGIGPLTGSAHCTIPAGGSSCTVSGLKLGVEQSGAIITAHRTSGVSLADGASLPFNVNASAAAPLDVDASVIATGYDALTDGLLVIRYLFGLTGSALTGSATGPTATRLHPADIQAYLDSIRPALDIDGNGTTDALTDGLLIVRYLSGLRGTALISNAIDATAARTTATAIESYLETLMP